MEFVISDCLDYVKTLEDKSVNLFYFDPPFGTTANKWDKSLNWKELFPEMFKKLKDDGNIVIHASMPFTYELIKHKTPRYHWIWIKDTTTNFWHAKLQPLRKQEEVLIYYKKRGATYNPQMVGDEFHKKCYGGKSKYYHSTKVSTKMKDYEEQNRKKKDEGHYGKYPTNIIEFPRDTRREDGATRSNELIDYFVKTYSNEGDLVIDLTCHSGIMGERCGELKRKYVGVDIQENKNWENILEKF
jgi:site-specific DNA-methyltransferase (adenine-specific)